MTDQDPSSIPPEWRFADELRKFLLADKKRALEAIEAGGPEGWHMVVRVIDNIIARMEILAIAIQSGGA